MILKKDESKIVTTNEFLSIFLEDIPLIDVRSEIEFSKGHFPQAVNLPILNSDERHKVGLCYKQEGQEKAIELGHNLVNGPVKKERVQKWCEFLRNQSKCFLFCFRGGLRSQSAQQWIEDEGLQVRRVAGGQKALRRFLLQSLNNPNHEMPFIIIGGLTGVGKTLFLEERRNLMKTCDLEGLANHRGSAFGKRSGQTPSQITFENALAQKLLQQQHSLIKGPLLLENESRKIGKCQIPEAIFRKMQQSPIIVLEKTKAQRVEYILQSYIYEKNIFYQEHSPHPLKDFHEDITKSFLGLASRLGGLRLQECLREVDLAFQLQEKENSIRPHTLWIEKILFYYYDPIYQRHLNKNSSRIIFRGGQEEIDHFLDKYYKN